MAETEEGLWMSAKERDRLKVLHEVRKRHITQRQAAAELGISVRWVGMLLKRLRVHGDRGLRHRLRGKRSNRKAPEELKQRAVELFRQKQQARLWHDYGPTLAAEELSEQHGIHISRETLRHWLIEAKLWRPRRAHVERAHVWRARRARYGELVQWDTSEHNWLEGRGEKLYLIAMIDDATSHLTARFVRHDSTEENLRQLGSYLGAARTPGGGLHRQSQLVSSHAASDSPSRCSRTAADANWTSAEGVECRVDRGPFAAGERTHRALVSNRAGPAGERFAADRSRRPGDGQSVSAASLHTILEPAFSSRAATSRRCSSSCAKGNQSGFGVEHPPQPDIGPRPHDSLGWGNLPGGSQANCQRHARNSGAGRAATWWKPVDALANANPATEALPSQNSGAPRESCQKTPRCTGKIGTGESAG